MRSRRLTTILASAAAGCLALGVLAAPASAAPKQIDYVGLGDSYSYGTGNGGYSYVDKLDTPKPIVGDKRAVPGATSEQVLSGQVADLGGPDLVTITVGGNDVGWGMVVAQCTTPEGDCRGALNSAYVIMGTVLPSRLDQLFEEIDTSAPNAKVIVLGYPHLFTPDPAQPATYQAFTLLNQAADDLNRVIQGQAVAAGFEFVDVTDRFDGHGVNTLDPWITSPTADGPLHPNAKGQQAYYAAVRSTGNLG